MALFHTTVLDNQIKALPTVDTASGSIATFDTDMTENLVSCVCDIPYNASGYSGMNIYQRSRNLWNEETEKGVINTTTGENSPSDYALRTKNYIPITSSTTFYCCLVAVANIWCLFYDINKDVITGYSTGRGHSSNASRIDNYLFTTPSNCKFIRFYITTTYGTTYNHDVAILYPSTQTNYVAYNSNSDVYSITFGQTIYGGEFEAVTGTLTDKYNSDGTEKTPVKIQLLGAEIPTFDNDINNIFNDTGDTTVKYILSIGSYINQNV